MNESGTFDDPFPMLGVIHLLRYSCDVQENMQALVAWAMLSQKVSVFEGQPLGTVLTSGHYIMALKGMLIKSEVLDSLKWSTFCLPNDHASVPFVQSASLWMCYTPKIVWSVSQSLSRHVLLLLYDNS